MSAVGCFDRRDRIDLARCRQADRRSLSAVRMTGRNTG